MSKLTACPWLQFFTKSTGEGGYLCTPLAILREPHFDNRYKKVYLTAVPSRLILRLGCIGDLFSAQKADHHAALWDVSRLSECTSCSPEGWKGRGEEGDNCNLLYCLELEVYNRQYTSFECQYQNPLHFLFLVLIGAVVF